MNKYDVSVCVLSYNPDYRELVTTLFSVLGQKEIAFEILVADDGSADNHFSELEALFRENRFENYQLIGHEQNQGTVLNCFDAVRQAQGRYTKLIAAGDYLHDENVLKNIVDFMDRQHAQVSFSDLVYYRRGDIHTLVADRTMPQETETYHRQDPEGQILYYLVLSDKVCGASWFTGTETLKTYLEKIAGRLIYSEDSIYRLMVADKIQLIHQPFISEYYQIGEGSSTSGSAKWRERLYKDDTEMNLILIDRLKETGGSGRLIRYLEIEKEHNRKKTNIMKSIFFPGSVIKWFRMKKNPRFTGTTSDFTYIDECCRRCEQECPTEG